MSVPKENMKMAKLAEMSERYEDMAQYMKEGIELHKNTVLEPDERNLLSVAYKNVVGQKRSAFRCLTGISVDEKNEKIRLDYIKTIEKELRTICNEVVDLVEQLLKALPDEDIEGKVFFYKMKGDYCRYLSEVALASKSEDKDELRGNSEQAYKDASELATKLKATHPVRLGLALNFSVFYYEICEKSAEACALAKKAFDEAIGELDQLQDDSYKDSTLIMQLLRDNLTLWTADRDEEEKDTQGTGDQ